MKRIKVKAILTLLLGILPTVLPAKDLGTVGKTYSIVESDALSELETKASRVDWGRMVTMVHPGKYRPLDLAALPRSRTSSTRMIDMAYTLETDIVDTNGTVLYPKGYTFNPLDYLVFDKTIVLINGDDREQVEWFVKSSHNKKTATILCITAGSATNLRKRLRRPVFYATSKILGKFTIRSVPSIVTRKGSMMEVAEVGFPLGWKQKEVLQ